MSDFLPFAVPEIGDEEIEEVVDSLRSGWVTTGPKVKKFEDKFAKFLGDNELYCISVNSATAGLHLALEALRIGPGDEVIVPTYTFTATAEVIRYLGGTPVFIDVDPSTFNISSELFEKAITNRTKAVIPVHFAGLPCNMDKIIQVAKRNNIRIVEDAAHALPTRYKGQLVGTLDTEFSVFSFYANKTMTTGEGGMVVTRDPSLANRCKIMRLHGISKDVFDRYVSEKPSWYYEVVAPGFKYNMPDISAAIGIHQLDRLKLFREKRAQLANRYYDRLASLPLKLPVNSESNSEHAWHLFPIKVMNDAKVDRDTFISEMMKLGIGCSVHFIPLHLQPYWKETYKLNQNNFPNAQIAFEQEVSIPLYTKMSFEDQDRVIDAVYRVLS